MPGTSKRIGRIFAHRHTSWRCFNCNGSVTPEQMQFPKPVDDTTQNYGLTGEYVGTSPWGQRLTLKAGYKGSQYTDNFASYLGCKTHTGQWRL